MDDPTRLVDEIAVFDELDDATRRLLVDRLEPVAVAGGEVLIHEGDAADSLYLVAVGRLRVTGRRDDGTQQTLAELGRGELVGEMALITEEARSATVTAVRDTLVWRLPAPAFLDLLQVHPAILRRVTTRVVGRLVRSLRGGTPTSPVATIAVVPLDEEAERAPFAEHLRSSLDRWAGAARAATRVSEAEATAELGDLERVGPERLAAWFGAREAISPVVVYQAGARPGGWTEGCIRQADLILLVGAARSSAAIRPVEDLVERARARVPVRTHLVLLHPPGTSDPRGTRRWLAARTVERHHHVAADRTADVDRVARFLLGRAIGLVFSGGGARGLAGIGVLRALDELSVPYDAVGGVSIGALIGGAAARGQDVDQLTALLRAAVVDSSPFDVTFPAVSLAAGRRVTRLLQDAAAGLDIEDGWRPFFCVSTNLTRGRVEVHRSGPGWHAIRASFSIPGVFPPVRSDTGDLLVDGGVLDNLPVGVMRAEHAGITVIAVDVRRARDLGGGALPSDGIVSGWRVLLDRIDPTARGRDRAGLGRILLRLTELGNERDGDRGDLRIRPAIDAYGIADFAGFDRLVDLGHEAAEAAIRDWPGASDARAAR